MTQENNKTDNIPEDTKAYLNYLKANMNEYNKHSKKVYNYYTKSHKSTSEVYLSVAKKINDAKRI